MWYKHSKFIFAILFVYYFPLQSRAATTESTAQTLTLSNASSVNNNANQAQDSNSSGAQKNNAAGSALNTAGMGLMAAGAAMSANPTTAAKGQAMIAAGTALMALGSLAFQQGGENSKAASGAGDTAALTSPDSSTTSSGLDDWGYTSDYQTNKDYLTNVAAVNKLESMGYKVGDGTVVTPDGKTLTSSSLTDSSSLKSMGLDESGVSKVKSAIKDAANYAQKEFEKNKKTDPSAANVVQMDYDGGGGHGGSQGGGGDNGHGGSVSRMGGHAIAQRSAASVAGMSVNYGDTKIGVAADDIFKMIERRYKYKDKQNAFLSK